MKTEKGGKNCSSSHRYSMIDQIAPVPLLSEYLRYDKGKRKDSLKKRNY